MLCGNTGGEYGCFAKYLEQARAQPRYRSNIIPHTKKTSEERVSEVSNSILSLSTLLRLLARRYIDYLGFF
jgi:hypothetical protein